MPTQGTFTVTEDTLLGGRLRLTQPARGYRVAVDPVLLAALTPVVRGESVLDLGCGVGAAALCLMARVPDLTVTGLEIQPELAVLAVRNAAANGFKAFSVVEGDAARPRSDLGSFDHVITNPPFAQPGRGTPPSGASRAIAHVEGQLDLSGWIRAAARRLKPRGYLTLIHRAERLDHLLAALVERGFGGLRVTPIHPRTETPASRVVITACKGARGPLCLEAGRILHQEDGRYTPWASSILAPSPCHSRADDYIPQG